MTISKARSLKKEQHKTFDFQHVLYSLSNRIRQSLELQEIVSTTAEAIQTFLETDRVMIYRFQSDGSGEVLAESIQGDRLPSLLGLSFPSEDIPDHARETFVQSRLRIIIDVNSHHKTLNQLKDSETDKDYSIDDIRYSTVDPCHVEYLSNMGISSSITIPILYQNKLWGLLVSHHGEPRQYSQDELQVVQLLVDQLSIAIAQADLLHQTRQQVQYEFKINQIQKLLHSVYDVAEIRQSVLEKAVTTFDGNGGRLYVIANQTGQPPQVYICGEQPTIPGIEETSVWRQSLGLSLEPALQTTLNSTLKLRSSLKQSASDESGKELPIIHKNDSVEQYDSTPQSYSINDLYKDSKLKVLASAFDKTDISSILIIPLQYRHQCIGYLTLFRAAIDTQKLWAGHWDKDIRNARPRKSFEAWKEIKKNQARTWTSDEIRLAQAIGSHLYMAVMQRRVEELIRHQASHDQLTGLPNRLLFNERLSLALALAHQTGEMVGVMFIDLDRFKSINDTLGHSTGDQLLQLVTQRLKTSLSHYDTLARWGGDEFTLILPHLQATQNATQIAERIIAKLKAPFNFNGQELHITTSIGIVLAPYNGEDVETLLKNADTAMYRAKQHGRNNFQVYTPEMHTQTLDQLLLANDLYKAINRCEFVLHYQPQVDFKTGQIIGMEALIRWSHPERGLISPYHFIPLAEETGQIKAIGEWVILTACAQNKAWQMSGLAPIRVAVNLSACQFHQQGLVRFIEKALADTGLAPQYLEVEITESIAMQDVKTTISVLKELREMGVFISIDDFGTGYSSLATLKNFPLNTLKIDREFVKDLTTNSKDLALIKAILALGHGLDLMVIAEGVETVEQQEILRSLHCDALQGYLFCKPLAAEPATQMLKNCK